MGSDRGYTRFFSYLNFFVFSMLLLVLAGNIVLLIVGWAFVGAASYLLISFWYRRATATAAGIKAFVINVIGDIALVVAAFILFNHTHSLSYAGIFNGAHEVFHTNSGALVAACLLITVGGVRQVGAGAAPHLVAGRDGGSHPGLGPDPRRHDGHRGRLPDRPLPLALRAGADRRHTSRPGSPASRSSSPPRWRWPSPT